MQLDLDMEIGTDGLRSDSVDQRSSHNGGRLSVASSIFHLSPYNTSTSLIRSSSLVSLAPTQREPVPERSRSSMSFITNALDGLSSAKPVQCLKKEENIISKTINSHFFKFNETYKSKEQNSLSRFKATDYRTDSLSQSMLSEKCSSCSEKMGQSLLSTENENETRKVEEGGRKKSLECINDDKEQ